LNSWFVRFFRFYLICARDQDMHPPKMLAFVCLSTRKITQNIVDELRSLMLNSRTRPSLET